MPRIKRSPAVVAAQNKLMELSYQELETGHAQLKALLEEVLAHGEPIRSYRLGICFNWDWVHAYSAVASIAADWPDARNPGTDDSYPIPENHPNYYPWEGLPGVMRIDLMRYMLKRLRDWKRRAWVREGRPTIKQSTTG